MLRVGRQRGGRWLVLCTRTSHVLGDYDNPYQQWAHIVTGQQMTLAAAKRMHKRGK